MRFSFPRNVRSTFLGNVERGECVGGEREGGRKEEKEGEEGRERERESVCVCVGGERGRKEGRVRE